MFAALVDKIKARLIGVLAAPVLNSFAGTVIRHGVGAVSAAIATTGWLSAEDLTRWTDSTEKIVAGAVGLGIAVVLSWAKVKFGDKLARALLSAPEIVSVTRVK